MLLVSGLTPSYHYVIIINETYRFVLSVLKKAPRLVAIRKDVVNAITICVALKKVSENLRILIFH